MKYFFSSRSYRHYLSLPRRRWGRALLLTCMIWLMAWSLSFAQEGGARPEIIVNMPEQIENTGEPFDIEVSVRNLGDDVAQYGSITLSFPEGHDISIRDASVLTVEGSECVLEGSHARVLGPDSGCEALKHNTSCQERELIEQPIAELFDREWAAGEQQSMTVRVQPNPGSSFVTVYARAAFRSPEEGACKLILDPADGGGNGIDQQDFPIYTYVIELIEPLTEVPPTEVPPTEVPPTEVPPTEVPPTEVPPTEVPPTEVPPTEVPPTEVPPTETALPPTLEPTLPPATAVPTDVPLEPTEVPIEPIATDVPQVDPSPTATNPVATIAPVEPTAIPPVQPTPEADFITLFLSGMASNFSYLMLCVIFMVLFLMFCMLIWVLFRSRGSSNPPPPSQPFAPPSQPFAPPSQPFAPPSQPFAPPSQPNTPSHSVSYVPPSQPSTPSHSVSYAPPSQPNTPSYPAGYTPPISHAPPAGEGATRKWNDNTPRQQPYSSPPASSSQPMGATQPEIKPPTSPFVTKLVVSSPPIEPTCFQCGIDQRSEASFCSTCGFPRPVIGGRYALLRHLGKGGMGAVYLAEDKRIVGKQWAVKEMLDQLSTSKEMEQKVKDAFVQEAQLLATLKHPNLPRVIDFLNEEERYYLVMDFVEGETLQDLLDMQQTPFTEQQVLGWVSQLCDVLTYLHEQQPPIVFRDLKPSNIMLTRDGRIQLIDFGIARIFKPDRDQDTIFMGTPGYAAPEQFSGSAQTDARTDVYALGVVLHHLLSKHPPETTMFTMPKVSQLNPAISPRMEAVIEQALQHDPAQRFSSMIAVKTALGLS